MKNIHNPIAPPTDAPVYLETGDDKLAVMHNLLLRSGLLLSVTNWWQKSKKAKEDFSIVIKPAIYKQGSQAATDLSTDHELVDYLISQLTREGFINITILAEKGELPDGYFTMLKSTVHKISLAEDENLIYNFGSFLGRQPINAAWYNANFRISFAKNRTNNGTFYSGCISNISFCTVVDSKKKHINGRKILNAEYQVLLTDRLLVHFGLLDAWTSGDGQTGTHMQNTKTLIASESLLALDWVMGEKMNINPAYNTVVQEAMYRWGTVKLVRLGNMTPWAGWKNPSAITVLLNNLFFHAKN